MKKLPLLVASLSMLGSFFVPGIVSAALLNTTNALDYISTDGASILSFGTVSGQYTSVGMAYKPGASHNICTVDFAIKVSGSPIDALNLQIRTGYPTGDPQTSGTLVQQANADVQIRSTTTQETARFTFSPCAILIGGNTYSFVLSRDGSSSNTNYYFVSLDGNGSSPYTFASSSLGMFGEFRYLNSGTLLGSSLGSRINSHDIVLNGTENFSAFSPDQFSSTSSSANCTRPSSILDVGGGVSYALCYMFVPSPEVLNQFGNLGDLMVTKVPFEYVYDVENYFGNITADATTSIPTITLGLHDLGIGSTSPMGNFLPNWTVLSSSTILTYMSQNQLDTFKTMIVVVLWVSLAYYYVKRISGLFSSI